MAFLRIPPLAVGATLLLLLEPSAGQALPLRIGFVDPALPGVTPSRNAAALAFAGSVGEAVRLRFAVGKGWLDAAGAPHAPEEFDVIWYHQGDSTTDAGLDRESCADLGEYVDGGGSLLLTGAAGQVLNTAGIEPTGLRVLGPTAASYTSGLLVPPEHRGHPAFAGLDATQPIILTSVGGNALADFYGTAGPHGTLLAEGNAGLGERPLVEYEVGVGHVVFVGWRLPDFTTANDAFRPNLERLTANLLHYLADTNTNRGRLVRPPGQSTYERFLGMPFFRGTAPGDLALGGARPGEWAEVLTAEGEGAIAAGHGLFVREAEATELADPVRGLGLTVVARERPAQAFVAQREAEDQRQRDEETQLIAGLPIIQPEVTFTPGPLAPSQWPDDETTVVLRRSAFMAPGEGLGDCTPVYEPIEDGGFRIAGSRRQLNRPIVHGMNRLWTGDVPLFRMDSVMGCGAYSTDRVYPLWPRPRASEGGTYPAMGTLRLGVPLGDGRTVWLDELTDTVTEFRPGYTDYTVRAPDDSWRATIWVAPTLSFHGMVCRVEFGEPTRLQWRFGGIWWDPTEANANRAEMTGGAVRITEANLPNGLVLAGWDTPSEGRITQESSGQGAEFTASEPQRIYHIVATWGITEHDHELAEQVMARLDTPNASGWANERDRLKRLWYDCYMAPALEPAAHFASLRRSAEAELLRTRQHWDARRREFHVHTPDEHLNALVNWSRCVSEYHRYGPGLVLGAHFWHMYSHISTGWKGKQWGGDHQALADCLRLYGAMQADDGVIRWVSPSLAPFVAEDNTPYWVDQVWWHYAWTGDAQFVRDLWPAVKRAVACECRQNDPDGDGLFRSWYEYWNCDSNGKGPKAAAPSATGWAMLDCAARLAVVAGDDAAATEYARQAQRSRERILFELWRDDRGRLGSIGSDGIWRAQGQTWEQYLAINAGLLTPDRGRAAMRWIERHYGFEPNPGVNLLAVSGWFPIRWSTQWVPTGDTCLAALAGIRCGDADLWWPYLRTAVLSSFRSDFPGINMGIANTGAGGGDREDVDSDDPFTHVVVRGLFGIEPALHEARIDITPGLPSDWTAASIRTPDVEYEYRRDGDHATLHIRTPQPVAKRVRVGVDGETVTTPAEAESTVTVRVGAPAAPPEPGPRPQVRVELAVQEQPGGPPTVRVVAGDPGRPLGADAPPLGEAEANRQVLVDLTHAYNTTPAGMATTPFVFDYADSPSPLEGWWGNPGIALGPGTPRVLRAGNGVRFLVAGWPRAALGAEPDSLIALCSWAPQPFPAGVTLSVDAHAQAVWLLLLSYVHPMRNYVPNGEIVLHYADGEPETTSLIPPFNLDAYFQHFSLEGIPVPLGRLEGGGFVHPGLSVPHADALRLPCDPARRLVRVELRATCSEAVLGLMGLTLVRAD